MQIRRTAENIYFSLDREDTLQGDADGFLAALERHVPPSAREFDEATKQGRIEVEYENVFNHLRHTYRIRKRRSAP
ncbi:MAG: hypothetical protein U0Z53_23590 [Blastocatellia bacterium]